MSDKKDEKKNDCCVAAGCVDVYVKEPTKMTYTLESGHKVVIKVYPNNDNETFYFDDHLYWCLNNGIQLHQNHLPEDLISCVCSRFLKDIKHVLLQKKKHNGFKYLALVELTDGSYALVCDYVDGITIEPLFFKSKDRALSAFDKCTPEDFGKHRTYCDQF